MDPYFYFQQLYSFKTDERATKRQKRKIEKQKNRIFRQILFQDKSNPLIKCLDRKLYLLKCTHFMAYTIYFAKLYAFLFMFRLFVLCPFCFFFLLVLFVCNLPFVQSYSAMSFLPNETVTVYRQCTFQYVYV